MTTSPWWKKYPHPSRAELASDPSPGNRPIFAVGETVRLVGKWGQKRRVVKVFWHRYRNEWAYVVETSAPMNVWEVYWFGSQLIRADEVEESLND